MKKTLMIAVGAATAAILAPSAAADEQSFLQEVRQAGIHDEHGEVGLIATGFTVCRMMRQGMGERQIAEATVHQDDAVHGGAGVTYDQAGTFVIAAHHNLCPEIPTR